MVRKTSSELILEHLRGIDDKLDKVRTQDIPNMKADIRELKIKASFWGGITGLIGGFLTFLIPHR